MCITRAYAQEELLLPVQVRAHELRSLAGSWAHWNGISVQDIKQALCWRMGGIFQNCFLRNMAGSAVGLQRLGPIVAAGSLLP